MSQYAKLNTISLLIPCHCCRRNFYPRTEFGGSGACCDGDRLDYCINCLKCQRHCLCRGQKVRGYANAYNVKYEVFEDFSEDETDAGEDFTADESISAVEVQDYTGTNGSGEVT